MIFFSTIKSSGKVEAPDSFVIVIYIGFDSLYQYVT